MPLRVKLLASAGLLSAVALVGFIAWLMALTLGAFAAVAISLLGLALLVWWVFTYAPQLDLSGLSLCRGPRRPEVALTFDDGPSEWTGPVLDALARHHAKATFFFLGENAQRHRDLVSRTRAEGHAIGNHGQSHRKMHKFSAREIEQEIQKAEETLSPVAEIGGRKLVRVPHGFKSWRLCRVLGRLGYQLIAWTTGVWDSDRPGAAVIARRSAAALKPGAILLLHDGDGTRTAPDRRQTAEALPSILAAGEKAGLRFVTLPELFRTER